MTKSSENVDQQSIAHDYNCCYSSVMVLPFPLLKQFFIKTAANIFSKMSSCGTRVMLASQSATSFCPHNFPYVALVSWLAFAPLSLDLSTGTMLHRVSQHLSFTALFHFNPFPPTLPGPASLAAMNHYLISLALNTLDYFNIFLNPRYLKCQCSVSK